MKINGTSWQERDKAVSIIENELGIFVNVNAESGAEWILPSRLEMESLYAKLRELALEHARIEN